ncbi:DNA repair protein RecO [Candidatus Uhrbacteria bacterium]|nr:DNA repair protein RecO [Candidatus Uhrbacteria bacterium]
MSTTFRDQAIVLKTVPMRDADRRYVVYGRERGKMILLAKGVRRGRSKMSPHMAWFGTVDIMVARGKILDRLAGASLARPFDGVLESLTKASLAQGFLLAVDALTRQEQPDRRIFGLIGDFLEVLDRADLIRSPDGRGPLFDAAALKLLDAVGFGPELDRCVRCRKPSGPSMAMNFMQGGLECQACRRPDSLPLLPETVERLRRFRNAPLSESAAVPPPFQATARVIETLLGNQVDDRYPAMSFLRRVAA